MRVLILHNRYRAAGGEERAVANLVEMLTRRGHAVQLLERSSDRLGRAAAARALIGGGADPDEIGHAAARFGADVVHAHNLHPLFGWRALEAARGAGAAVVLHLHNFRLYCAIGIAFREGRPCFDCRGRDTLPGLIHRCRGSLAEATVYATGLTRQQPRLIAGSDRMLTVSRFTADRLGELGAPRERIDVLANFIPDGSIADRSHAADGRYALAYGRLVREKGFDTAIGAARAAGVPLVIAGDGPAAPELAALATGADVTLTGFVSPERLLELRRGAAVCLVPSRCDEACPYSVLEAFADGVPVIGSTRGGLPELLTDQLAVAADDDRAWATALARVWQDRSLRAQLGARALASARGRLSEQRYHDELLAVYERAQAARREPDTAATAIRRG